MKTSQHHIPDEPVTVVVQDILGNILDPALYGRYLDPDCDLYAARHQAAYEYTDAHGGHCDFHYPDLVLARYCYSPDAFGGMGETIMLTIPRPSNYPIDPPPECVWRLWHLNPTTAVGPPRISEENLATLRTVLMRYNGRTILSDTPARAIPIATEQEWQALIDLAGLQTNSEPTPAERDQFPDTF